MGLFQTSHTVRHDRPSPLEMQSKGASRATASEAAISKLSPECVVEDPCLAHADYARSYAPSRDDRV